MITINEVQASLIARIKNSDIPAMLVDVNGTARPEEVRAYQWQGTKFGYPAIRVKVNTLKAINTSCSRVTVTGTILVLGENPSALLINDIGSALVELFHGQPFSDSVGQFSAIECTQMGGERVEEVGAWVSEVQLSLNAA
jgi:hypothetical protein